MTVTQGSDKAIVNWNGFSIGQGHAVNFVQPDASSAILNRVTGSATSDIAGSLTGNGQVYIINPNGIAITSTGTVKVGGGFVASTLDVSDGDFLKGNLVFNGDGTSAGVSNAGVVTVGRGGYAALMGGTVRNDGLIAVPLGKVGLGSGEQAALDLSGDGFMQVAVPTADGAEGEGALVDNKGTIAADGGVVVMQAATARETARRAINLSGVVEAKTIDGKDGAIVIGGGEGGAVQVSGKVKATAERGRGGSVKITGRDIALKGATVDASGASGGGSVKIGGDWQGKAGTHRAQRNTVDKATIIRADATEAGNGGTVVVWSDDLTTFGGLITARGTGNGAGGNAEVSGKAMLAYSGLADLSSQGGAFGTLLLDPYNVTITSNTGGASSGFTATTKDSVIDVNTLTAALALANVEVSTGSSGTQAGNITVASAISWTAPTKLKLNAAGGIAINADITATGANAGLDLVFNGWTGYTIDRAASVTLSGSNSSLSINGTNFKLIRSMDDLAGLDRNGSYALANDIDASGKVYTSAPIGEFYGAFTGMGNKISNLTVSGTSSRAGLFSKAGNGAVIRNIGIVGGNITGGDDVGGLIGISDRAVVKDSYYSGTVTGKMNVGGLIGRIQEYGVVNQSYADGSVSGTTYVGGLVGNSEGTVKYSYAKNNVSGDTDVGGLVGFNQGTVSQAYATGNVTGKSRVGGLVGVNDVPVWSSQKAVIEKSYAAGKVTGDVDVGGLVGRIGSNPSSVLGKSSITASYWDVDTSGTTVGIGMNSTQFTVATGLTTAEFQDTAGFYARALAAGWNFGTDWAPSSPGYYPELYALSDVVMIMAKNVGIYYGDNIPTLTGTVNGKTWDHIFGTSDTSRWTLPEFATQATSTSDAGKYSITPKNSSGSIVGNNNQTYRVVNFAGQLNIIPAKLTVTGSDATMIYGGSIPSDLGYTISGWKNGHTDSLLTGVTVAPNATATSAVGTGYKTNPTGGTLSGPASGNYTLVYTGGKFSVTPRAITVTANDLSRMYGDSNPSLTYTVTGAGLVDGDTLSGALATAAKATSGLGTYEISQGSLANKNYTITYVSGNLSVTPRAITVTANDLSRVYGDGNPLLTYTVSGAGLVNGDTLAGALATAADATSGVGKYAIAQGSLANENYAVTFVDGNLSVTPRGITVTATDLSRIYGDANPALVYKVTDGALINGDMLSGELATVATTTSGVGKYAISQGSLANENYEISYVGGNLSVTPRAITVTANDLSRAYGTANPSLTYTISGAGLINGDTLAGELATTAGKVSGAGEYAISQGTLANENYAIGFVGGVLTVTGGATPPTPTDPETGMPLVGSFQTTGAQTVATLIPTFATTVGAPSLTDESGSATSQGSDTATQDTKKAKQKKN